MASDSATRFIKKNRPPRVNISYADPYEVEKQVELPFVMAVMSDLSGNASKVEKPEFKDREFGMVDQDNLDDYMESVAPGAAFTVENTLDPDAGDKLSVSLEFSNMADFGPAQVARQVPALRKLLEAREELANLQRYMNGKSAAQDQIKELLNDPDLMKALNERRQAAITASETDDSEDE